MIIKKKVSLAEAAATLDSLLTLPLNSQQRFLVARELKTLRAGERGEQDSAYFLDFAYGNSKNWALIHDLRLEWKGRVAQIDHLAINRFLEVYVLETKNFFYGIKINEQGEFYAWNGKTYVGIESPIEQNKRHIAVLEDRLKVSNITPRRLGMSIPVKLSSYILVSPKSKIIRPQGKRFSTDNVIKADQFHSLMDRSADEISSVNALTSVVKVVSSDTLAEFAKGLAAFHRPGRVDYRAKFGIPADLKSEPALAASPAPSSMGRSGKVCEKCKVPVDPKVVAFCRYNRKALGGYKVLCRECQKIVRQGGMRN